jgi:hypothetical protein
VGAFRASRYLAIRRVEMNEMNGTVSKPQPSPVEILQAQYETLAAMYQDQAAYNRRMVAAVEEMNSRDSNYYGQVKIEDINMPFIAMIGLLVKIALASIPAVIIFSIIMFILWTILTIFLAALIF